MRAGAERLLARVDMRLALAAFAVAIVATIWVVVPAELANREEREVAGIMRENANLARAFEEHTTRTLQSIDQLALLAKAEYQRAGAAFDIGAFARTARLDANVVLDLFFTDEQGRVVLATEGIPRGSVADREYFHVHRDHDSGKSYVSVPFFGRFNPRWVMPVSMRVNKPDGTFGGAVVLVIDPHYFSAFYRTIDLRKGGVVTLAGKDGMVRARVAERDSELGQDVSRTALFQAVLSQSDGSLVTLSSIDAIPRIYSYRSLRDYPLFLVVGTSETEGLAAVRSARAQTYQLTSLASALIVAFTAWVIVLLSRQRRAQSVLRAREQQQKALLDSIADGAWMKDASGRYIAANPAFARVFGATPEVVIGRTNFEVFTHTRASPQHRTAEDEEVRRSGQLRRHEYELCRDGETRWVETIKVPILDADGVAWGIAGTARDVTDRKALEDRLRESDERLRRAMRHGNIGMWDWDIASGVVMQTDRVPVLLGQTPAAPMTTRDELLAAVHPDDRERVHGAAQTCLSGGTEYEAEYRVVWPDGSIHWLHDRGDVIRSAEGKPLRMSGILQDVTQRRTAEDDLRASESYFRTIFEQSALGMAIVEPDGRRLRVNAAFCSMLGYTETELLGLAADVYTAPGDRENTTRMRQETLAAGRGGFQQEKRYRHRDGSTIWGLMNATLVRDASGSLVHFVSQVVDITARKNAELALQEAEERFRIFVENMQEMFWIATPGLEEIVYVSPAFSTIFGMPAEGIVREPDAWRRVVHVDDWSAVTGFVSEQQAGRSAECEVRIERPDGAVRWLLVRSIPWHRSDGTPLAVGVVDDITSRKLLHEERVRAAELQRDTLVMEVHHRIKNNLQGVVGLLRQHGAGNAAIRAVLDMAATQIQSVALVHGLQGRHAGNGVALPELVRLIAEALEPLGQARVQVRDRMARGATLRLKDRESVPVALILNELMWNAIKHSPPGAKRIWVEVTSGENRTHARVEVRNSGETAARFFEESGRAGASGLGLVQALMPPRGASLQFDVDGGVVRAVLTLGPPVLAADATALVLVRESAGAA